MNNEFRDLVNINQKNITDSKHLGGRTTDDQQISHNYYKTEVQLTAVSNNNYDTSNEESSQLGNCSVCHDRATGRHYGALSCDGCKGFFRRSVRDRKEYICSGIRNCLVNKPKRNKCRYCRLRKCYTAGMKLKAVQDTRDKISVRQKQVLGNVDLSELNIYSLKNAANSAKLIQTLRQVPAQCIKVDSEPTVVTMTEQLEKLIVWVKHLQVFQKLDIDDQLLLLKSHVFEHIVMGVAYRSATIEKNVIFMYNDDKLDERSSADTNMITVLLKQLVSQFRFYNLDNEEYLLLKAIKLFNPDIKDLNHKMTIQGLQKKMLITLEDYVTEKLFDTRGRVGELLLLLSLIISISKDIMEILSKCKTQIQRYCDVLFKTM